MKTLNHTKLKIFTLCAVWVMGLGLSQTEAAFMRLQVTPYDRQMKPVQNVLQREATRGVTVEYQEVMQWMRQISNFRYSRTNKWHTPAETLKRRAGDCKDKAVLLLNYFKDKACADVKLVIGKKRPNSTETHAWVEWKHNGQWIILDPTHDRKPVYDPRSGDYSKQFVFMGGKKYSYVSRSILTAGL